jgi:GNAT superfamily N-acetyltransferase
VIRVHALDAGDPEQVAALQALMESVPGYTRRVTGRGPDPADAAEVLHALPPGHPPERKVCLGLWEGGGPSALLAFADVLHGWPRPGAAHIGLLAVHGQHHGRGLGRRLHDEVVALAATWRGVTRTRLGIVATNADAAEPFWRSLGYRPTGEVRPYESGRVSSTSTIWERELTPRPAP